MLEIGSKAPAFTLPRDGEGSVSLSDFKGKWVIIYFYPKDLTSGCTKQAITFTEMADEFNRANAVILGISPDSVASHNKFKTKHDLDIILLADEQKQAISAYDVWKEKKMYGRSYMGVERSTFLVDSKGIIKALWRKVKIPGHAEEILQLIREN